MALRYRGGPHWVGDREGPQRRHHRRDPAVEGREIQEIDDGPDPRPAGPRRTRLATRGEPSGAPQPSHAAAPPPGGAPPPPGWEPPSGGFTPPPPWGTVPPPGGAPPPPPYRRLYRLRHDRVVAGVASGLAAHMEVDPVWIRLAFVVLTFIGGLGILLYIVGWVVMPAVDAISPRRVDARTPLPPSLPPPPRPGRRRGRLRAGRPHGGGPHLGPARLRGPRLLRRHRGDPLHRRVGAGTGGRRHPPVWGGAASPCQARAWRRPAHRRRCLLPDHRRARPGQQLRLYDSGSGVGRGPDLHRCAVPGRGLLARRAPGRTPPATSVPASSRRVRSPAAGAGRCLPRTRLPPAPAGTRTAPAYTPAYTPPSTVLHPAAGLRLPAYGRRPRGRERLPLQRPPPRRRSASRR